MSATVDGAPTVRSPAYLTDLALYRSDFRSYLRHLDWSDEWRGAVHSSAEAAMAHGATVLARLYDAGWNRYGWPEHIGGLGGNELHRAVYYEELGHAMLPVPAQHWTLETLGPALIKYAPTLAAASLPDYLCGKQWWGQCFSEPEAGSDLAALRTRGTEDSRGGLIINGQKIWTSQGPTAARLLALVRTGSTDSRHRGLTMVLVDADAAGVTVRPIALASGRLELAEVFFDDVAVPATRIVGDINGGWAVAMHLMQYERGMYGYAVLTAALTELAHLRPQLSAHGASAALRERFAHTYIDVLAAQARTAKTVRSLAAGEEVGPGSSIDKLLFSKVEKEVHDLIFDVRRDQIVAGDQSCTAAARDSARAQWWYSRAATIMGGTAEVQRGIIADHILQLPREKR
ncbi:acyl-CoA dehydrogenase [Mycolicibacterium sp. CH28]|uniref:acyl-CoA dehydrogenase family protein n=1 Tax=Mycolicibacterium sp. CH28 TaxID=2512237 RepID=UPI00108071A2|nr:acyl-CoA dehydrogenase family protein [Mycolicibacterium sp. CH28]TGD87074.1 acyl-CoA dehydrogenase [Mycolicibacterium sp. CH28]